MKIRLQMEEKAPLIVDWRNLSSLVIQALSLCDSFIALTERERKALEKSWAKIFADEIFPAIDEERFSVLYSDKASRPNAPVNVIIGAFIIKELFGNSDDEIVENLMLDLGLQYALQNS